MQLNISAQLSDTDSDYNFDDESDYNSDNDSNCDSDDDSNCDSDDDFVDDPYDPKYFCYANGDSDESYKSPTNELFQCIEKKYSKQQIKK